MYINIFYILRSADLHMNVLSALLFLTTILKYAMIYEYLKIYEKGLEIKTIRNYGGKMNTLFRKMKKAGMK